MDWRNGRSVVGIMMALLRCSERPGDRGGDAETGWLKQVVCRGGPGIMLAVWAVLRPGRCRSLGKMTMTTVPAGQRLWKCPDCGKEIALPITQLDPIACDQCLAKLKGGRSSSPATSGQTDLAGKFFALLPLLAVGVGMLLVGLLVGFIAGRASVPPAPFVRPTRPDEDSTSHRLPEPDAAPAADEPNEATRPGPGYKWVRGYQRKDGVKVKGYWAKDSKYVEPSRERRK